jgi:hypothetical protein
MLTRQNKFFGANMVLFVINVWKRRLPFSHPNDLRSLSYDFTFVG